MKILVVLCVLGVSGAMQGARLPGSRCRRRVTYEDDGPLDERELALLQDDPWEGSYMLAHDASASEKYDRATWMKKNKPNLLRSLGPDHPVEVEGGKVCLMFIPVGDNCKPALGIIAERDMLRLHKLGSQFVPLKDTISNHAFMVECVNKAIWLKWMKLEF